MKEYYKVICDEFPEGVIHERRYDALTFSKEEREMGGKSYTRKIKMKEEDFEAIQEI